MTATSTTKAPVPASPSPAWENVPFDVGCARCGQDLRSLTEPVCPACGLTFDWAEAVPIERLTCGKCGYHLYGLTGTRCPECGTGFTWEVTLADYRRSHGPFFEYRWRRRPIRSLVGGWVLSLRPGRFWASVSMHDPPRVAPLLVVPVASLVVLAFLCASLGAFDLWIADWADGSSSTALSDLLVDLRFYLNDALSPDWAAPLPFDPMNLLVFLSLWYVATLSALLLLRQTMNRHRVRWPHVVRICSYGLTAVPLVAVAVVLILHGADAAFGTRRHSIALAPGIAVAVIVVFTIVTIRQAYHRYLRIPHAWGIAVTSQVIAVLTTGLCEMTVSPQLRYSVMFQFMQFLRLV